MPSDPLLKKIKTFLPLEGILFLSLVILNFLSFFYLIVTRRLILGHDGFSDFTIDYYFLNSAVVHHEIPQWIPFVAHGTTDLWWFIVQGIPGLLTNMLFLIAPLLKGINFLTVFYLEIFLDELILLTGTWVLARRFYSSPYTVFLYPAVFYSPVSP